MESNDKLEKLLRQMYTLESLHDNDIDTSDIVDEAWTKFEAEHFGDGKRSVKTERFSFLKIAAIFVGVLLLSGITYAAVQMINSSSQKLQKEQVVATVNTSSVRPAPISPARPTTSPLRTFMLTFWMK